ncbi:hypothetical protein ES703_24224 [subsurface metagenome]
MMPMQSPKSLTAMVHIRFHYGDPIAKPPNESQIELLSELMDRATELSPELQELLVQFANHLRKVDSKPGQSP